MLKTSCEITLQVGAKEAVKLAGEEAAIVVGAFDVVGNTIAGAINIGLAFAITAPEPLFYKQYMAYFPNK